MVCQTTIKEAKEIMTDQESEVAIEHVHSVPDQRSGCLKSDSVILHPSTLLVIDQVDQRFAVDSDKVVYG